MKTNPSGTLGAIALAALHARDPLAMERNFQFLTPPALAALEQGMTETSRVHMASSPTSDREAEEFTTDCNTVLAKAVIRRMVHKCLAGKYANKWSSRAMEDALRYHTLPESLQRDLSQRYNTKDSQQNDLSPPKTWFEALEQLKGLSNGDSSILWRLLLDHPMTAYVPMQCQDCGHVIPDVSGEDDKDIGLSEIDPTGDELEIRGGWFRGRPRGAKILALTCPACHSTATKWYRSGHPQIILNPYRWGRLCGEQEDLRIMLADYLNIPLRLSLPLDWDHVWSEFYNDQQHQWEVPDDSARNFAVRLDEGIGAWTRVWVIHPDPNLCQDVTDDYFQCQSSSQNDNRHHNGRADEKFADRMKGYKQIVEAARLDPTAKATQAKTLNGYVLERANFTSERITNEMRKAVDDYRETSWWKI